MAVQLPIVLTEQVVARVCGEYLEMPGLRLTQKQAQRLWGLDQATCIQILEFLIDVKFLRQSDAGTYARITDGAAVVPELRMARAGLPGRATRIRG